MFFIKLSFWLFLLTYNNVLYYSVILVVYWFGNSLYYSSHSRLVRLGYESKSCLLEKMHNVMSERLQMIFRICSFLPSTNDRTSTYLFSVLLFIIMPLRLYDKIEYLILLHIVLVLCRTPWSSVIFSLQIKTHTQTH